MNIVYMHQFFNTPSMSGITRTYEMARRLVQRGHCVQVVTSDTSPRPDRTREWYTTEEAGIDVHWCPIPYSNHMGFARRKLAYMHFAWAAARKAVSLSGDVVLVSSPPLTIALPALYATRRLKIPMVLEVRDLWPEAPIRMGALKNPVSRWMAHTLELAAYRNSRRIIALAPRMKASIVARAFDPEHVQVIPNCCDFDSFDVPKHAGLEFRSRFPWLQNRPMIVYAGTLGHVNGVDYLVRVAAVARRINPEIRFVIVGSGCQFEKVERLARSLGVLNENLFLLGRLPKEQLPAVLSAADIATSLVVNIKELSADSANKFFDALAARRAIAINHGGYLADLLRLRDAGLVIDPEDFESAARTLVSAVTDSNWVKRAGMAAYEMGRDLFDRDQMAERLEDVLLEAVGDVSYLSRRREFEHRHAA